MQVDPLSISSVSDPSALRTALKGIDGRSYGSYRAILGCYSFGSFSLIIDRVQRDPFAPPTLARILIPLSECGFSPDLYSNRARRNGFCDYLTRSIARYLADSERIAAGSGNSGRLEISIPGQEIVERTSVQLTAGQIEVRLYAGLPATGRKITADAACALLITEIPSVVEAALIASSSDEDLLRRHVEVNEDQEVMRSQLAQLGLIAFLADGSILPRRSGEDDRRAENPDIVPVSSPASCRIRLTTLHRGDVDGMGIRAGVTLITGGGYHGKSTFLQALERGVYNHIPGDGREGVVTLKSAVKIRAEEGRSIRSVDISPFLRDLPTGQPTVDFSTANASGSTSQAASLVESVEAGAAVLLLDEDTSASNFLARDDQLARLIPASEEPIHPLAGSVRRLYSEHGISTVLVTGASSAFFSQADQVLRCRSFTMEDVTEDARRVSDYPLADPSSGGTSAMLCRESVRCIAGLGLSEGDGRVRFRGGVLQVDDTALQIGGLEQIPVDGGNAAESLGHALLLCEDFVADEPSMRELLLRVERTIDRLGLDKLSGRISGKLVRPRALEIAGAINRMRGLQTV